MESINIMDIKIPGYIERSNFSAKKYDKKNERYKKDGKLRQIILDDENYLIDGYLSYLILINNGYTGEIKILRRHNKGSQVRKYINTPTLYVYGKHKNNDKEYIWRVGSNLIDYIDCEGKEAIVQTKYGLKVITITRTEVLDNPPIEGYIEKVKIVLEAAITEK